MKQAKTLSVLEHLKKQVKEQSDGRPDEIDELVFHEIPIKQFTKEITDFLAKFPKLIALEFNNCQLTTLDGFKAPDSIVKLCFEENELDASAIQFIVQTFPKLQFLSLIANKISDLKDLEPLYKLTSLLQVNLKENEVAKHEDYRKNLFANCPKLEVLDDIDRDGNECQYSEIDDDDIDDAEIDDDDESYAQDDDDDEEFDEEELEESDKPAKKRKK